MQFGKGEIIITPKTIYWVEMPDGIGEHDKIELLKQDILLIRCSGVGDQLIKLREKNNKSAAFFYNLDGIIYKNHVKETELYKFLSNIIQFIKSLSPKKSLIYTTIIDKKVEELFKKEGILFLEKNLNDRKFAITTILSLIPAIFSGKEESTRCFLRLNLMPSKYKVVITNLLKPSSNITNGFLKDLSLNGMGLLTNNPEDIKNFNLKDLIEIKVYIKDSIIKITKSIITRIDSTSGEMGVTYNINDNTMIREDYASYLTGMIYQWIKEVIAEFGFITSDDAGKK